MLNVITADENGDFFVGKQVMVFAKSATDALRKLYRPLKEPQQTKKLPNKRQGYRQKFIVDGLTIYLSTGEYEDGTLGEIFIDIDKTGSTLRALVNCFAMMVSMSLQNGMDLKVLVDKFIRTKFEPAGMVQCSDDIKSCSSIIDLIFRELAIRYLGREELKHV